ncbi:hypothetical protein [uncultured Clostridium sp.]|uniref:hypothetical protein n=1 Tax=uncultured Clostridium sp. TaxID=59620 RepID=UPI00260F40A9|nr:hypothetical protein [uncultured Clostridium sp.]
MNSYNLKEIQETLNKVHPKQIINKVGNLKFSLFKVKYQYTTNRNNKKEGIKYFFINTFNPQYNIKEELNKWVIDYNNENKHRQISNVKFLESQCLGFLNI